MPLFRGRLTVLALLFTGTASAQIPDKFTNLQVLPKDITKAELVMTMRNIAGDLGFRCHNCHVGPDDLTGMDFAIDEKPTKKVAREMLKMVQSVNATLKTLPPRAEPGAAEPRGSVTCYTCHRGAQRPPERVDMLIARTTQEKGVETAIAKYKELRRDHAEDGQYNFAAEGLGAAAGRLLEAGKVDDALALTRLNLESHGDVAQLNSFLGQILMRKGDKAGAVEAFQKALKLDPKNPAALRGMKAAEAPPKQ